MKRLFLCILFSSGLLYGMKHLLPECGGSSPNIDENSETYICERAHRLAERLFYEKFSEIILPYFMTLVTDYDKKSAKQFDAEFDKISDQLDFNACRVAIIRDMYGNHLLKSRLEEEIEQWKTLGNTTRGKIIERICDELNNSYSSYSDEMRIDLEHALVLAAQMQRKRNEAHPPAPKKKKIKKRVRKTQAE